MGKPPGPNVVILNLVTRARELANSGCYQDAINTLNEAIYKAPSDSRLLINRSFCYYEIECYKESLEDAQIAINMDPSKGSGYFRKGCALLQFNRFRAAEQCFNESIRLNYNVDECKKLLTDTFKRYAIEFTGMTNDEWINNLNSSQYKSINDIFDAIVYSKAQFDHVMNHFSDKLTPGPNGDHRTDQNGVDANQNGEEDSQGTEDSVTPYDSVSVVKSHEDNDENAIYYSDDEQVTVELSQSVPLQLPNNGSYDPVNEWQKRIVTSPNSSDTIRAPKSNPIGLKLIPESPDQSEMVKQKLQEKEIQKKLEEQKLQQQKYDEQIRQLKLEEERKRSEFEQQKKQIELVEQQRQRDLEEQKKQIELLEKRSREEAEQKELLERRLLVQRRKVEEERLRKEIERQEKEREMQRQMDEQRRIQEERRQKQFEEQQRLLKERRQRQLEEELRQREIQEKLRIQKEVEEIERKQRELEQKLIIEKQRMRKEMEERMQREMEEQRKFEERRELLQQQQQQRQPLSSTPKPSAKAPTLQPKYLTPKTPTTKPMLYFNTGNSAPSADPW